MNLIRAFIAALISIVLFSSILAAAGCLAEPPVENRSVTKLHVEGHQIKDAAGRSIVLHGVSIADPMFLSTVDKHFTEEDFAELAQEWNALVVRVPIHPDLWRSNPEYAADYLDPIVNWGEKCGLYILLGWHAHGNPHTGQVDIPLWSNTPPWRGNPYDPDLALAKDAWQYIAARYADKPWVLYSIFSEPSYISWKDWRGLAENLVDIIHSQNPEALVLVPGVEHGYNLNGATAEPVRRENVVYETHVYPSNARPWEEYFGDLAEKYPVFVGEWGYEPADEYLDATREGYAEPLLKFLSSRGIGWIAWCWHPEWRPRMIEDWTYKTTEYGQFVKERLLKYRK